MMRLRIPAHLLALGSALAVFSLLAACSPIMPPAGNAAAATESAVLPTVTPRPGAALQSSPALTVTLPMTVPAEPVPGGVLVIATTQTPAVLSPLFATSAIEDALSALVVEGLVQVSAEGRYVPALAASLPEVSADGLTITYTLKSGITFSDGAPFGCPDVQFTHAAVMSELSQANRAGYRDIVEVACPDDLTAVVTFNRVYAPYLRLFSFILPRGAGDLAALDAWDYHRRPVGTGPWLLDAAEPGGSFQFAPNPLYREQGKPYLDRVVVRVFPGRASAMESLVAGESHVFWGLTQGETIAMPDRAAQGIVFTAARTGENELLLLNLADPALEAPDVSTTAANPHPVLGDLRVRQAIQFAIDKQRIVDDLLAGQVAPGSSVLPSGPFACPLQPSVYDPAQARALLDEAGWRPAADGIRTRDEQRLTLRITTTADNSVRERTQELLGSMLAAAGIELVPENVPAEELFAGWDGQSLRKLGNFDILLYTTGPALDPHSHLFQNYHSASIPTAENGGTGSNFSRYVNSDVNSWIDQAATTADVDARRELYCQVAAQINADLPRIFLYERLQASAHTARLQNFSVTPGPADFAVDSQNWWLVP